MTNLDDTKIPFGNYCYSVTDLKSGEVLLDDVHQYGFNLREFKFGHDQKAILCPHWRRTHHGTVLCTRIKLEVFAEHESHAKELEKVASYFGTDDLFKHVSHSWRLADEIKVCGLKLSQETER